jgi:hypothetical protein
MDVDTRKSRMRALRDLTAVAAEAAAIGNLIVEGVLVLVGIRVAIVAARLIGIRV